MFCTWEQDYIYYQYQSTPIALISCDDILIFNIVRTYILSDLESICREIFPGGYRDKSFYIYNNIVISLKCWHSSSLYSWGDPGSWVDQSSSKVGQDIVSLFSYLSNKTYEWSLNAFVEKFKINRRAANLPYISNISGWDIAVNPIRGHFDMDVQCEVKVSLMWDRSFIYRNKYGAPILIVENIFDLNKKSVQIYKVLCERKKDGILRWLAVNPVYIMPYQTDKIFKTPSSTVVLFETEEHATQNFDTKFIASTVPGGLANLAKADLSVLAGHPVIVVFHPKSLVHGLVIRDKLQKVGAVSLRFALETDKYATDFSRLEEYAFTHAIKLLPLDDAVAVPESLRIPKPDDPIPGGDVIREMLLNPIIKAGELIWLFADAKVGKTWLAHVIADAVASGNTVVGKWRAESRYDVLVVDGEMSPDGLQNVTNMVIAGSVHTSSGRQYAVLCAKSQNEGIIDLEDEEIQRSIETGLDGIKLLILDNFQSLTGNGPTALKNLRPWLRRITRSGVAVIVLDHTNREGELQGSIEKERIADLTVALRYPDEHAKAEGRIEVEFPAPRRLHGADAEPFQLRKIFTEAMGDEPASFRLEIVEDPKEGAVPVPDKIKRMARVVFAKDTEKLSYPRIEADYDIPQATAHGDYKASKTLSIPERESFDKELQRLNADRNGR